MQNQEGVPIMRNTLQKQRRRAAEQARIEALPPEEREAAELQRKEKQRLRRQNSRQKAYQKKQQEQQQQRQQQRQQQQQQIKEDNLIREKVDQDSLIREKERKKRERTRQREYIRKQEEKEREQAVLREKLQQSLLPKKRQVTFGTMSWFWSSGSAEKKGNPSLFDGEDTLGFERDESRNAASVDDGFATPESNTGGEDLDDDKLLATAQKLLRKDETLDDKLESAYKDFQNKLDEDFDTEAAIAKAKREARVESHKQYVSSMQKRGEKRMDLAMTMARASIQKNISRSGRKNATTPVVNTPARNVHTPAASGGQASFDDGEVADRGLLSKQDLAGRKIRFAEDPTEDSPTITDTDRDAALAWLRQDTNGSDDEDEEPQDDNEPEEEEPEDDEPEDEGELEPEDEAPAPPGTPRSLKKSMTVEAINEMPENHFYAYLVAAHSKGLIENSVASETVTVLTNSQLLACLKKLDKSYRKGTKGKNDMVKDIKKWLKYKK
uniref:Uncharacterized protein n=1 Tax=Amphora coffeiformis TaxID=265554 RepID=A0A7S3L2H1_9STRA|eukprot:scaffold2765_cov165-Amphora_coffeaeformis.AAC.19